MTALKIAVVGSVNLDIVASVEKLPVAGETVTGAKLNRYPGGKGANQALAASRLGAEVALIACVGNDSYADEALALLQQGNVDLSGCVRKQGAVTGIALISVDSVGENQIVVAPGANHQLDADEISIPNAAGLICQLEIPDEPLLKACNSFDGFFCINLAPARTVPDELIAAADLIVVNETEAQFYGDSLRNYQGIIATTYGAKGAELSKNNQLIAKASPPKIKAVDATGAGDTFTAALTVAILEGQEYQKALEFACAAGAASTTKAGAQTSLPSRKKVEDIL